MDEYVKVIFPTRRKVWVDGKPAGYTNKDFQVETGEHKFALGPKKNYTPDEQVEVVIGTTPEDPKIIIFTIKEDGL